MKSGLVILHTAFILVLFLLLPADSDARNLEIPAGHYNIYHDSDGNLYYLTEAGDTMKMYYEPGKYTLSKLRVTPEGTDAGLRFNFGDSTLNGWIYYGFFPDLDEVKHAYPIYSSRTAIIENGISEVDIKNKLVGKYDFIGWQESGLMRLGYRILNDRGQILYDGKLILTGKGPFEVDTCIIEGPFINMIQPNSAVVSFETNYPAVCSVMVDGRVFSDLKAGLHHEIRLNGLEPDKIYDYSVFYDSYDESHSYRTAPEPGARTKFTFAYASDGRGNTGGGERDIKGVNSYILKRIAVLCNQKDVRFFQFTGDLIDGYVIDPDEISLEYANWKRTIEPFAHSMPFVASFGNHESLLHYFSDGKRGATIDKFPYDSVSAEAVFARNFVNPLNGPDSEDGCQYDPDPDKVDFPSYKENAFYYTYDNVAIISLNSNYWFSPSIKYEQKIGGNLHGYIMDNQLKWCKEVLEKFEDDDAIDHVFVTLHTPIFPNGGHVKDDMWYSGDNSKRPWVNGEPVEHGIIERRDQLLDLMMNHSTKVRASLTGDEHNYSLLRVTEELTIYPEDYDGKKLTKFRPFWHINNGAAGAPYYGREETPWMDHVEAFSTQNAVVLFHVEGKCIEVEVVNPDTWEELDRFEIVAE